VISYNQASKLALFQTGANLPLSQNTELSRYQSYTTDSLVVPKTLLYAGS